MCARARAYAEPQINHKKSSLLRHAGCIDITQTVLSTRTPRTVEEKQQHPVRSAREIAICIHHGT